jgi:hypothetical protein
MLDEALRPWIVVPIGHDHHPYPRSVLHRSLDQAACAERFIVGVDGYHEHALLRGRGILSHGGGQCRMVEA